MRRGTYHSTQKSRHSHPKRTCNKKSEQNKCQELEIFLSIGYTISKNKIQPLKIIAHLLNQYKSGKSFVPTSNCNYLHRNTCKWIKTYSH